MNTLPEQTHIMRFTPAGSLMEFSPRLQVSKFSRGKRGEIQSFSLRSRSRLNRKIAMLSRGVLPSFVTLTYHTDIPESFEGYKYHLHHFIISLFRRFPSAGVIWKLEFQKRGHAHYHLFIWGVSTEDLQAFVPDTWHKIAGYRSTFHLAWHKGELGNGNEHCVQPIRSWNGVRSYSAKYFSKIDSTDRGGRVWGVRGQVPFSKILEFRVSLDVALKFREAVSRQMNFDFQRLGFWCANFDIEWLLYFDDLCLFEWVENNPPDDPPDWELHFDEFSQFEFTN